MSYIAVVIPITMIHTVPASGSVHLTWISGMRITGGLTEITATPRQSHPDAETAGNLKNPGAFRECFSGCISGACRKRTSRISTEENLLEHSLIADWCVN